MGMCQKSPHLHLTIAHKAEETAKNRFVPKRHCQLRSEGHASDGIRFRTLEANCR